MSEQEKNAFQIKLASSTDVELRALLKIKLNHVKDRMEASTTNNFPSEIIIQQIRDYSQTKMHLLTEFDVYTDAKTILASCAKVNKKILNTSNCTFPLVARTMAEIIYNFIRGTDQWHVEIMQLYLDDALAGRLWVDSAENSVFVQTILNSIVLKSNVKDKLGLYNRFSACYADLEVLILGNLKSKSQEPSSASLNHLLLTLFDLTLLPSVRSLVSKLLEKLLNNPAILENVKKLITKLVDCIEPRKEDPYTSEIDMINVSVVESIVKLRSSLMKTTAQMEFYKTILTAIVQKSRYLANLVLKLLIEQDVEDGYSRAANTKLVSSLYLILPSDTASQVFGVVINEIIHANAIKFTASNYNVGAKNILDELAKLCRTIGLKNMEIKIFLRELFPENDHESLVSRYVTQDCSLKHLYFALVGEVLILLQLLFCQEIVVNEKEGLMNKDKQIPSSASTKKAAVSSLFINKSVKVASKVPLAAKSGANDSTGNQLRKESIFLIQEVACTWISSIYIKMYNSHNISVESNDNGSTWLEWVEKITVFFKGIQSFNFEYDKTTLSNLKEVGGASDPMLISLINLAATSSATSKTNMSLWIKLIDDVVQRAMLRHNIYDVNDVNIVHRLFSLTCISVRTNSCDKYTVDTRLFEKAQNSEGLFRQPTKDIKPQRASKNIRRKLPPFLPPIADKWLYWRVCVLCYLLGCGSPGTIGKYLWTHVPSIKNLMLMTLSSRFNHKLSNTSQASDFNDSVLFLHSQNSYVIYHSDCKGTLMVTKEKVEPINNIDVFEESIFELETKLHKHLFEPIADEIYLQSSAKMKRKLLYLEEQRRDDEERIERREREKNARAERAAARAGMKQSSIPATKDKIDESIEMQVDDNVTTEEIESVYVVPELTSDSPSPYFTQFQDARFGDDKDEGIVFLNLAGLPRRPPIDAMQVLKKLDSAYNFGSVLRMCIDPDFIESTLLGLDDSRDVKNENSSCNSMSREVIEKSKSWLLPTIAVDTSILNRLPAVTRIHILSISSFSIWNFCEKYQLWDAEEAHLLEQQDCSTNISLMCKLTLQLRAELVTEGAAADMEELMQYLFRDIHSYRREVRIATRMTLNLLLALLQLDEAGVEDAQTILFRILQQRKFHQCDYNSLCVLLSASIQNSLKVSLMTSLYVEGDVAASFEILTSPIIPMIHQISFFATRPLQIGAMICNDELHPRVQKLFVEIADHLISCIKSGKELKGVVASQHGDASADFNFLSSQKRYVSKDALRFMLHAYHLYVRFVSSEDEVVLEEGQDNDLSDSNIKASLLEVVKTVSTILDVVSIEEMELLQLFKFSLALTNDAECGHFLVNLPANIVSKLLITYHEEYSPSMLACIIKSLGVANCIPVQGNVTMQESLRETFHILVSKSHGKEYESLLNSPTLKSLFDAYVPAVQNTSPTHMQLPSISSTDEVQSKIDMPMSQRNDIAIEVVVTKLITIHQDLPWEQKLVAMLPFVSGSPTVNWDNLSTVLKTIKSQQLCDSDAIVTAVVYFTLKNGIKSTSFLSALEILVEYVATLHIKRSTLEQRIGAKHPLLQTHFTGINTVQSLVDSTLNLLATYVGNHTDLTKALAILRDKRMHYFKSDELVVVEINEDVDGSHLLQLLVYNIYLRFPAEVSKVFCSSDEDKYNFHWHMTSLQRLTCTSLADDNRYDDSMPSKKRYSLKTVHPYSDALTSAAISQENLDAGDDVAWYCPADHVFTLSLITLFNGMNSKIQNIKYLDCSDESISYTDLKGDVDTASQFILSVATEHPTIFMRHINYILRELRVAIMIDNNSIGTNSDRHHLVFDAEVASREHVEINVQFSNTSENLYLFQVIHKCLSALTPYLDKHDAVTHEIRNIVDSMM